MNPDQIRKLAQKYLQGTATEEEAKLLHEWFDTTNAGETEMVVTDNPVTAEQFGSEMLAELKSKIAGNKTLPVVKKRIKWMRAAAAAIIILMLGAGTYFLFIKQKQKQITKIETQQRGLKNDVAPGGNKAILTLANGKQIILDSAANGTLTQQGNTKVIKLDSGQLAYQATGPESLEGSKNWLAEVGYNMISTPRGGQYQIVLADGSKVWLNAASSLKFPALFVGKVRNVELTGEGYFEVAKNEKMPFHVKVNDMQVEVLGTHFNVKAYGDEDIIKTTLLEGSVKVSKGSNSKMIKPLEQAIAMNNGQLTITNNVDVDEVMAWKNGLFNFNHADIKEIMRQAARWYDVDVVYEGNISNEKYIGKVARNTNLSEMMKILGLNGVKYRIEGKKITVVQ